MAPILIDRHHLNLDFEPAVNYDGERYPFTVRSDERDCELVNRGWREYGFRRD